MRSATVGAGCNDIFSTKWYLLASPRSASNRHGFAADSRYNDSSNLMDVFKTTSRKTTFIHFDRFGHIIIVRVRLQIVPVTDCLQSRNGGQNLYSFKLNTLLYPAHGKEVSSWDQTRDNVWPVAGCLWHTTCKGPKNNMT